MQLEHSFEVPVGIEQAWEVLLDIERIAPCMPGAALDTVDGDDFTGTVKVKLGPIGLTYKGKASFVEKDASAHRAVIDARGRDSRGNGTANAKITATLAEKADSTQVTVTTDLDITGKPAQFGRGVMVDVGNKLIGQFADCLSRKLGEGDAPAGSGPAGDGSTAADSAVAAPGTSSAAASTSDGDAAGASLASERPPPGGRPVAPLRAAGSHAAPADEVEPINLLDSAGPAVAKRLVPLVAGLAVLAFVLRRVFK